VKLLLDSHAFLWCSPRIRSSAPKRKRRWPIPHRSSTSAPRPSGSSIKATLGKLDLDGADLIKEIEENDFVELPMTARHALAAATLPPHHEDPFDRMLIAQAQIEGLTIVTRDPAFRAYGVTILTT
jgi:PIN domain nuclease of toxin-antitoxin system